MDTFAPASRTFKPEPAIKPADSYKGAKAESEVVSHFTMVVAVLVGAGLGALLVKFCTCLCKAIDAMDFYHALDAIDRETGLVNAVIDTPKGSNGKYKHKPSSGLFRLNKLLPLGAYFPYNFGFVPRTRGDDGDELDILVIMDEPLHIGAVVQVRIIGVLRAEQSEDGRTMRNDRLLGVLETRHNPPEIRHYKDLSPQRLAEIERFFLSYNLMEGRAFKNLGRGGPQEAMRLIEDHRVTEQA